MDSICDCIAFTFKFSPELLNHGQFGVYIDKILSNINVSDGHTNSISGDELTEGNNLTDADKQAIYRYFILKNLLYEGVINENKDHHLLGVQNTMALNEICSFPWVKSIDTSNPVVYGFNGLSYESNIITFPYMDKDDNRITNRQVHITIGNAGKDKPSTVLGDFFEHDFYNSDSGMLRYGHILHNIRAFRDIVNPLHLVDPNDIGY
jgi:hypothetical protein